MLWSNLCHFSHHVQRSIEILFPEIVYVDDVLAQRYLEPEEWQLYKNMIPADRQHGTRTARLLLAHHPTSSTALIRAAILHDVGKSIQQGRWQVFARIFFHIYTKYGTSYSHRLLRRFPSLHYDYHHYRNHADVGANMLIQRNGCPRVATLIAKHHIPENDAEAQILSDIDALF